MQHKDLCMTDECFVCVSPGAKHTCCSCKNLHVHDACLLKMVTAAGSPQCSVCKTDYANVRSVKSYSLTTNRSVIVAWICALGGLVMTASSINSLVSLLRTMPCTPVSYTLLVTGAIFLLIGSNIFFCGVTSLNRLHRSLHSFPMPVVCEQQFEFAICDVSKV